MFTYKLRQWIKLIYDSKYLFLLDFTNIFLPTYWLNAFKIFTYESYQFFFTNAI